MPSNSKEKKNRSGGIILLNFRQYYKDTVIKLHDTAQKQTHGSIEQYRSRNKAAHPQSINDKGGKNIQQRKDSLFSKW